MTKAQYVGMTNAQGPNPNQTPKPQFGDATLKHESTGDSHCG